MIEKLAILLAGLAGGITIVVACGDDTEPADAAAGCDCPEAEPPLTGRVVMVDEEGPPDSDAIIVSVNCPEGGLVLGGGCEITGDAANSLVLFEAGGNDGGEAYACKWENPASVETTGRAWARCLLPPPE